MKNIIIAILILGFTSTITAQKIKYSRMDSLAYDLAYTKYNVGKFKGQFITGLVIFTSGFVSMSVSNALIAQPIYDASNYQSSTTDYNQLIKDYNDKKMIASLICGGVTLVGAIIILDSFSWLKRASIKPSQYGVSFTYDLDFDE